MKIFSRNKIGLVILISFLILITAFYFGESKLKNKTVPILKFSKSNSDSTTKCSIPLKTIVTKVIDGDTIVVEGGYHIRLLGIDADERGYPCYQSAKENLEKLVLNKKVKLEKDITDVDKYGRCLRYIFLGKENINLELVKEGLAVARFYQPNVKYQQEIQKAEKEAIKNKVGCKWSLKKTDSENSKNQEKEINLHWRKLTPELTGLKVVKNCQAESYLDKKVIIEGKIVDTYRSEKSNVVFLNFEKPYPNQCFTAVIFNSNQYNFVKNPENYYLDKVVRIMGKVKSYKGKLEIILKSKNQIEVGN